MDAGFNDTTHITLTALFSLLVFAALVISKPLSVKRRSWGRPGGMSKSSGW